MLDLYIMKLLLEPKKRNIEFYFHQSVSILVKNSKNINKWILKGKIKWKEEIQHKLKKLY